MPSNDAAPIEPHMEDGAKLIDLSRNEAYSEVVIDDYPDDQLGTFYVSEERPGVVWNPKGGEQVAGGSAFDAVVELARTSGEPMSSSPEGLALAIRGLDAVLKDARERSGSGSLRKLDIAGSVRRVVTREFVRELMDK